MMQLRLKLGNGFRLRHVWGDWDAHAPPRPRSTVAESYRHPGRASLPFAACPVGEPPRPREQRATSAVTMGAAPALAAAATGPNLGSAGVLSTFGGVKGRASPPAKPGL